MKFTAVWSKLASENQLLKVTVAILSLCIVAFTFVVTHLAQKRPLVVERSCETALARLGNASVTEAEMEVFVKNALSQRFDTDDLTGTVYLSLSEQKLRDKEQQEMRERGIRQVVLTNKVSMKGEKIEVDADRLISVADVRSAFRFPLSLSISKTTRSEPNPYGLVVTSIKVIEEEKSK
jgi:hypothetical protein